MAISFSDAQIKEATGQALDAPNKVASAQAGITSATTLKQSYLTLDKINAVYTTNYSNIIIQYHTEYKYLTGTQYTDPDTTTIDAGGRLSTGNLYFPTGWTAFIPKVADQVLGNPTSTFSTTETEATTRATTYINQMLNGFNTSGTFNQSVSAYTSTTITTSASTGLSVGNPIIVYGSTGWAYGTVTTITAPILPATNYTITINVTQGALSGLGTSILALNKDAGFTLAERNAGSVSGSRNIYFSGLKTWIDTAVADWKTRLTAEQTALNANDATGSEATQITTAKTNVAASLTVINTWQSYTTPGTRFGTGLAALQTQFTTRSSQITARGTEITSALGSITQSSSDGSYTGSGNVYKYFDSLNQRLNMMTGTLRNYYQADMSIQAATQILTMAQSQAERDSSTFIIRTFSGDAKGTNTVSLTDVSGLTVGLSVKVMSNTQPVINTTITKITDAEVQLAASIPATYTTADKARVVK